MGTLSITKTYADTEVLLESDLDNIKDDVEGFINGANIADANITAGGVGTASIADLAVTTAKINTSAVTTAKINDAAVTTDKVNAGAITYAKMTLATGDVPTAKLTQDAGIIAGMIATGAVSTAKLADGAVTPAKRSTAVYGTAVTFAADGITSGGVISTTFTGTGRPMLLTISLQGLTDDTGNSTSAARVTSSLSNILYVYKNGSLLTTVMSTHAAGSHNFSAFTYIDTSGYSGSVTYDLRTNGGTMGPTQGSGQVGMYLNCIEL